MMNHRTCTLLYSGRKCDHCFLYFALRNAKVKSEPTQVQPNQQNVMYDIDFQFDTLPDTDQIQIIDVFKRSFFRFCNSNYAEVQR